MEILIPFLLSGVVGWLLSVTFLAGVVKVLARTGVKPGGEVGVAGRVLERKPL
jgi:hypothetical protein